MLRGTKVRVEAGDMKKKVTLLLVVLLVLGWYQTVNTAFAIPVRYAAHITAAEKYARKEIFEDALTEYQEALKLQPKSVRVKRSIAEMQLKLGNRPEFIRGCEALIGREELDEEALRMLAAYYDSNGKEEEIVLLLRELRGTHSGSEAVNELWDRYRGSYEELYYSYEEIKPFHDGYAVVKTEGKYGLIDMEGKGVIRQIYDAALFRRKRAVRRSARAGTGTISMKNSTKNWFRTRIMIIWALSPVELRPPDQAENSDSQIRS